MSNDNSGIAAAAGFTPGPWTLGGCSGRMITTPNGYVGDGFIADVDTLANANLIASAPDMLEALELCMAELSLYALEHPNNKTTNICVTMGEAAIAKARGVQS